MTSTHAPILRALLGPEAFRQGSRRLARKAAKAEAKRTALARHKIAIKAYRKTGAYQA